MILHTHGLSPNARKVEALLDHLDVEHERRDVALGRDTRTPEFLALNPNGKVPVLEDGDLVIWESVAILRWLAGTHPEAGLLPTDPRALVEVDRWLSWHDVHLQRILADANWERVFKPMIGRATDEDVARQADQAFARYAPILDAQLAAAGPWILGELSVVDFSVGPWIVLAEDAGLSLTAVPHVSAYAQRCAARFSPRG